MEAIIYYENTHDVPADQRVGYLDQGCKSDKDDDTQPLNIQ
jgi:hypothetical protein